MFKSNEMSLRITHLSIENFKCFKKRQDLKFEKITILTGANSSGKSSVMNAILGTIQSGQFPYRFSTNGKYVNMGDFKEISHNHTSKEIKIGLSFEQIENKVTYEYETEWQKNTYNFLPDLSSLKLITESFNLRLYRSPDTEMYFLDFEYDPAKDSHYTKEEERKNKERLINNFISTNSYKKNDKGLEKRLEKFKKYVGTMFEKLNMKKVKIKTLDKIIDEVGKKNKMMLNFAVDGLLKEVFNNYDRNINAISSFRLHPDRTYLEKSKDKLKIDKFGDGYLDQIILWEKNNPETFEKLQSSMRKLNLMHSINAHRIEGGRYEVLVKVNETGTKTSLFDVGFGISQFLPIIVADLQLDKNSTLFIAEPEIHLHPNVQAEFGNYIVEQVNLNNKNYVIETHSEYLLNRLRLEIVRGNLKEEDLCVYFLENDGKEVKIHDLKFTKKGGIKNAPDSFFDTYLMDLKDIALSAQL
jgi:predicted ATPase